MNEEATEIHSGDKIVCRKSAYDKIKRTYIGTDAKIVSAINASGGCRVIEGGAKSIEENGKVVQYKNGGKLKNPIDFKNIKKLTKEEKEAIRQKRWVKKREHVQELANGIQRLRLNVTKGLKSENEKEFLTCLIIAIMDKTGERIGNESSSAAGHFGITFFRKKHIKIEGNKVTLNYVGKSGVKHETYFSDEDIARHLKKAIENSTGYFVFTTSDGRRIRPERVNKFLSAFKISAKDIRGYNANKWILEKLKNVEIEEEENKRKVQLNKIITAVALKVGHGRGTLKMHYMIPELEYEFVHNGKIIDMKDMGYFGKGGEMKSKSKTLKKVMRAIKLESGGAIPIPKEKEPKEKEVKEIKEIKKGNDIISKNEVIKQLGRPLHFWNDDVINLNGVKYKKAFLQSHYVKI